MLNKLLVLLTLVLVGSAIAAFAWPHYFVESVKPTESAFNPQHIQLEPDLADLTGDALLERAAARFGPERVVWLKTKIRQNMTDAKSPFSAEGYLQRGPLNCARVELNVAAADTTAQVLLVSDGKWLAEVKKFPDRPAIEQMIQLAPTEGEAAAPPVDLNARGCGGPVGVLEQLRPRLANARVQPGMLHGVPVIRIQGDYSGEKLPLFSQAEIAVRTACVYLDAKTLWPIQFEWWGLDRGQPRRVLEIAFTEPELNQPLPGPECERLFSYRPQGNVGAVEVE